MTTKRPWTRHKIKDSALKQLAAAANREDGSLYPGIGRGAPASRMALRDRGLIEDKEQPCKTYNNMDWDTVINEAGREALAEARAEGW